MPTANEFTFRKINNPSIEELDRIDQILNAAYRGDALVNSLSAGRPENIYIRFNFQAGIVEGEVYVAGFGNSIDAVAIIFPPGSEFSGGSAISALPNDRQYALKEFIEKLPPNIADWWLRHVRPKYEETVTQALGSMEVGRANWYVRMLAVHPDRQRRGIGRALMNEITRQANAQGKFVYGEVVSDRNVRILRKMGFHVRITKNFSSQSGGFPLFMMVKEPQISK